MANLTNTSNANKNSWLEIFAIFAAIAIICLIWLFYPTFVENRDKPIQATPPSIVIPYKHPQTVEVSKQETELQKFGDTYGTYGDSYGSLNTLFSGLAFAILIISLFMQRQELQAQRQELEAQRNEIKESNNIAEGQRVITEQQAELIQQQIHDTKVQNFYNTLFKFLDEKRRKIEALELTKSSQIKGFYVLEMFVTYSLNYLKSVYVHKDLIDSEPIDQLQLIFDNIIQKGHENTKYQLIHSDYFEYICFILRFIEEQKNLGIENTAIKIFISHLSIDEMSCIFFVSLQNEELQNFILKYALLKKLNTYKPDEHFLALVDKTLGEESYCL